MIGGVMARWTDLAAWRGPTPNQGGKLAEHRGLVVHIAEGTFEGTISWCRNPSADVSAHFVVAKDGRIAQLVDTDTVAWCQRAGNSTWLSVENEGRAPNPLTEAQVEANARLLARAHRVYGVPLQVATSPSGRGLGHHSMGVNWGHQACPGPAIIGQKPAIVDRAKRIIAGQPSKGDDMPTANEIAKAVWDLDYVPSYNKDNPTWQSKTVLGYSMDLGRQNRAQIAALRAEVAQALGRPLPDEAEIVRGVLAGLDPAGIAAAVTAALPADLARQVLAELGARLDQAAAS